MVIIERLNSPVAYWWFENENEPIDRRTTPSDLRELLEMCQSVAEVLESYELLRPNMVILTDWIDPNSDNKYILNEEAAVAVPIPAQAGACQIVALCEETLSQLDATRKGSFLYPTTIDILGTGVVINSAGHKYEFPNVTWLSGTGGSRPAVDVNTQIDAWLPYTLLAEPQPEVCNYNRPRLEAALREIQSRLGIVPVTEEHNKYVLVNGLHLANYMDDDEPMVVVHQARSPWYRNVLL